MKSYKGLVRRYIKNEKKSIMPVFISMVLTISLITSVVFITQNMIKNELENKKNIFGDYDVRLQKINNERLEKIKKNDNVKDYTLARNNEVIVNKFEGKDRNSNFLNYINIYAAEKRFFDEYVNFNIIDGRLPENEKEIILNRSVLSLLGEKYGVGSEIQVNVRTLNVEDTYREASTELYEKFGVDSSIGLESVDKLIQELVDDSIKVEDDKKVNYTIVGIIETDEEDTLFGTKIIRLLSEEEIENQLNEFEVFAYLNNPSKIKDLANDLGIKYVKPTYSGIKGKVRYDTTEIKYPNYNKEEFSSIIKNGTSLTIIGVVIIFSLMAVYNTFQASVAKRIKVYGILRAIGGSMEQIKYLIYSETILLYLVAVPIGLLFGCILTRIESYILVDLIGLLEKFSMDFNIEVALLSVISVLLIVVIAVGGVLRKSGKLTPIEAIVDARGLSRKKKSLGRNIFGQNMAFSHSGKEDKEMVQLILAYEKSTFRHKIMKNIFKFEGELAQKNIERDGNSHRLTKSTLFIAMAIVIFFFLQVVNATVNKEGIVKSDKWDVEISLQSQGFDNENINKIKNVDGVESIYKISDDRISLVVSNDILSEDLKATLRSQGYEKITEKDTQGITASLMALDEKSISLYEGIDKKALDEGGVLLVKKATNVKIERSGDGKLYILENYSYLHTDEVIKSKAGDKLLLSKDDKVLTKEGLEEYYNSNRELKELNIIGTVDDDILTSTFKSVNRFELDYNIKLITTEAGLSKILGKSSNNKILIKTANNENRINTINELKKISARNNYGIRDTVAETIKLETNIEERLGLNIMFAITIIMMVILNLVNTTNALILARRKELSGMRAVGMSNAQERRMIIGESFYISISVAFNVILTIGLLTIANQSVNLAAGKVSLFYIVLGEVLIIIFLMIISNLTSLAPLAKAKKISIVEGLKEE